MKNSHEHALNNLLRHPRLIGIDNVVWSAKEPLCHYSKGSVEPDLLYHVKNYALPFFVIEYKNSDRRESKALEQLLRAEEFIQEVFGTQCYKLFVIPESKKVRKALRTDYRVVNMGEPPLTLVEECQYWGDIRDDS